jgi:hypothetical protein
MVSQAQSSSSWVGAPALPRSSTNPPGGGQGGVAWKPGLELFVKATVPRGLSHQQSFTELCFGPADRSLVSLA